MDGKTLIVVSFVIHSDGDISIQGSFQVFESLNTSTFRLRDGGDFHFTHSVSDMLCDLEVSYAKGGSVLAQCNLAVPVNHSKFKWKRHLLNDRYTIHYRCQLEDWDKGKLRKERNKLRRKAALRDSPAKASVFYKKE